MFSSFFGSASAEDGGAGSASDLTNVSEATTNTNTITQQGMPVSSGLTSGASSNGGYNTNITANMGAAGNRMSNVNNNNNNMQSMRFPAGPGQGTNNPNMMSMAAPMSSNRNPNQTMYGAAGGLESNAGPVSRMGNNNNNMMSGMNSGTAGGGAGGGGGGNSGAGGGGNANASGQRCDVCRSLIEAERGAERETIERSTRVVLGLMSHYSNTLLGVLTKRGAGTLGDSLSQPLGKPKKVDRSGRRTDASPTDSDDDDDDDQNSSSSSSIYCSIPCLIIIASLCIISLMIGLAGMQMYAPETMQSMFGGAFNIGGLSSGSSTSGAGPNSNLSGSGGKGPMPKSSAKAPGGKESANGNIKDAANPNPGPVTPGASSSTAAPPTPDSNKKSPTPGPGGADDAGAKGGSEGGPKAGSEGGKGAGGGGPGAAESEAE